jgi:hypothetical protein
MPGFERGGISALPGQRRIRASQCRTRNGRRDLPNPWAHLRLAFGARRVFAGSDLAVASPAIF